MAKQQITEHAEMVAVLKEAEVGTLGLVDADTDGFQDAWDSPIAEDLMFLTRKEAP